MELGIRLALCVLDSRINSSHLALKVVIVCINRPETGASDND